ncbi:MAG: Ribocuclease J [Candidatus Yanofskybacteria bacterium GW2011_GWA1_48_10]|uniref:Ribonuclease J n=1 Tax=Candidatus Yanofskybacteria bacterium GW2011_GWA1_48_10 TaxID=1619022 RepID=A0A0G1X3J3_9BACT|nr:MAG: Ribocuclease J [Candidatus Yanofskybacteria bacterium GW2011_GWA1_48_10]
MTEEKNNLAEAVLASARNTVRPDRSNSDQKKYTPRAPRRPRFGDRRRAKPVIRQVKVLHRTNVGGEEEHARKDVGLKIVHFGGLGEIGKNNMCAIQYNNEIILIDGGLGFPRQNMPGIDFSIPNVGYLAGKENSVLAWFFSHGHLDHIGAVPFIRDRIGDPDVYAAPLTRALLIRRMEEFKDKKPLDINELKAGDEISIGKYFKVKAHRISHSIPDDLLFEIKTPAGTIINAYDYKMDRDPVNDKPMNLDELRAVGDKGVLLFMGDSTGAEKEGHSLSESDVTHDLEKLMFEATGLTIVGCFASALNRVQQIITLAEKLGKKVVFDGYSMKNNVEIAKLLGYIKIQSGTQITLDEVSRHPRDKVVAVVTGAQGESNAALMRIANGEHRFIHPIANDTYIFSSSIIPGNESDIQFVKDQLYRNGAKVFNYQMLDVHSSGHGNKEDIRELYKLLRPKFLMPVHGQYSMMVNHGLIAQEEGHPKENVIIADNGTITHVEKDRWWIDKEQAPADPVYVDGLGIGDIGNVVLRDRQVLSEDGFVVLVTLVDSRTGKVKASPDIISRGFVYLKDQKDLLMQIRKKVRFIIENSNRQGTEINAAYLKDELRNQVGLFLFQKTERRPMILPVIIEV